MLNISNAYTQAKMIPIINAIEKELLICKNNVLFKMISSKKLIGVTIHAHQLKRTNKMKFPSKQLPIVHHIDYF